MIDIPLSILIISSNREEINILKSNIRSFAPNSLYVIAKNDKILEKRINWLDYHLVICDHQLPRNQAQRANLRLRIQLPYLPFILITDCPEMRNGLFSKESSTWSIRAVINREQLCKSGAVLHSVYNSSAEVVEQERTCQWRIKQRSLLLQKFDCLIKQALRPINTFKLEEISNLLFARYKLVKNALP
jgi:hypothetical protein